MPRRDYSKVAFAATGDTNIIPGSVQPDGSVSLPQGWGFDYQRDNGAGGGTRDPLAKNIDREDMNGILNEVTASIGEIQQSGSPEWVPTAVPYPINAIARYNNIVWQSLVSNNSDTPGSTANWLDKSQLPSGRHLRTLVFAANGTHTRLPNCNTVKTTIIAGGGGGGYASPNNVGSGGGGGGVSIKISAATGPVSVVVGAGGVAGTSTVSATAGGSSSYGSAHSATGGGPGAFNSSIAGAGGSSTNGDINIQGGTGFGSIVGGSGTLFLGGGGGDAPGFGSGAGYTQGATGVSGSGYGSGGGGGSLNNNGAAGQPGLVIVEEYS